MLGQRHRQLHIIKPTLNQVNVIPAPSGCASISKTNIYTCIFKRAIFHDHSYVLYNKIANKFQYRRQNA